MALQFNSQYEQLEKLSSSTKQNPPKTYLSWGLGYPVHQSRTHGTLVTRLWLFHLVIMFNLDCTSTWLNKSALNNHSLCVGSCRYVGAVHKLLNEQRT